MAILIIFLQLQLQTTTFQMAQMVLQKLAFLINCACILACSMMQAVFAHGAGWAINITTFKLYNHSQQRVRARSLSLGIKKTTEWIGSETLARYAIRKFNSIPC